MINRTRSILLQNIRCGGKAALSKTLLCLALTAVAVRANTTTNVPILSGVDLNGRIEWNNRTGANVVIRPNSEPIWKAPTLGGKWISYTLSGEGQQVVENASMSDGFPSPFSVTGIFYRSFTLPGAAMSGGVWVWADDTAAVFVDGISRYSLPSPAIRGTWCSATGIGCQPSMGAFIDMSGLGAGPHTLEIQAYQLWGNTFGVLYEGSIEAVPEGSTLIITAGATVLLLVSHGRSVARKPRLTHPFRGLRHIAASPSR